MATAFSSTDPVGVVDGENDADRSAVQRVEREERAALVIAEQLISGVVGKVEERQVRITHRPGRYHSQCGHQVFLGPPPR